MLICETRERERERERKFPPMAIAILVSQLLNYWYLFVHFYTMLFVFAFTIFPTFSLNHQILLVFFQGLFCYFL